MALGPMGRFLREGVVEPARFGIVISLKSVPLRTMKPELKFACSLKTSYLRTHTTKAPHPVPFCPNWCCGYEP
jgi:hypothetical protein